VTIGWKAISRTYDPWLWEFNRIVISHFTSSQVESLRRGEWRRLDFAKGPKGLFGSLAEQCWTFGNRFRTSKPQSVCFFRSIFFVSACSGEVFLHFALSDISFWDWDASRNRVLYPQTVGFLASTDQTRSMFWETFSWFGCTASKISYPDPGCTQL